MPVRSRNESVTRRVTTRTAIVVVVSAAIAVPALAAQRPGSAGGARSTAAPPDILLILTDDQRWDTIQAMPNVRASIAEHGVMFEDAFVTNALCCPSRASILTGDESHTTGVYRGTPPFGGFASFRDGSTVATWLDEAGYTTGLFGKYIDAYQHAALTGYVPPGWDRWVAFVRSKYLDYRLTVDGDLRTFGEEPADYSTAVLGSFAERFIRETAGPIFVAFAPAAPHAPATPEPRFAGAFDDLAPWRPPSFDEADVSDKPSFIRRLPRLGARAIAELDRLRRDQYRTLLSVDRQVQVLIDALEDTGRLDDTLIVFTSDNGLSWGEHRWVKKEVPYEESIRVPLVVRFDPLTAAQGPVTSPALALNIDIAPTIAELAGVPASTDGRSLVPLLRGDGSATWRDRFLIEHMEGANPVPTYCAVRTDRYLFSRYATGERELYDLDTDPFESTNVADDRPALIEELSRELSALCDPAPPGYHPREGAVAAVALGVVALFLAVAVRRRTLAGTR